MDVTEQNAKNEQYAKNGLSIAKRTAFLTESIMYSRRKLHEVSTRIEQLNREFEDLQEKLVQERAAYDDWMMYVEKRFANESDEWYFGKEPEA